jgi:hypothetical protein
MITLTAGANLQSALDTAPPGETIQLEAGATWLGNFTRRDPIAITGAATIRTPNSTPALRTLPYAAGWRLRDVTFAAGISQGDVLQLGDPAITDLAAIPRDIELERCTIRVDASAKRGVQLNSADTRLRSCRIEGVKLAGTESQAIGGWTGPGPFLIEDCYIEAGSIGILFGGARPSINGLTPSDITIRRNVITRPLSLRGQGIAKNLLELKHAKHVSITGNLMEHNWADAQSGFAVVFTVRANSPDAPWTTIEDVDFAFNIVRHSAMGVNVLGLDNQRAVQGDPSSVYPSVQMANVRVRQNLFYDIDRATQGGSGWFLAIDGAPRNLAIERNTVLQSGNIISASGEPCAGFRFVGNIVQRPPTGYGIFGTNVGEGNACIERYFPTAEISGNQFAGAMARLYSSRPDNGFPSLELLASEFVDPLSRDYRLRTWVDVGADLDAIGAARTPPMPDPEPPPPPPPPPAPTVREIINRVAADCLIDCTLVGGHVSPQQAAADAITSMWDALKASLADREEP